MMDSDAIPETHAPWFFTRLQAARTEGHLYDVTLCAERTEIPCHRFILLALSDYFRAMFCGGLADSAKEKVKIGGVSAEALQLLVDFAYTCEITITSDNVQQLYEAANMLQVEPVEEDCRKFLTDRLISNPETCLGTLILADKLSCSHLYELARSCALKSFASVCMTEEFLHLPVDYLKTYLSDDGLHAKKEEEVLDAIMLWVKHDLEERQRYLKELIECVRFSNVDPNYLEDIMKTDKVFAGVPGIEELIKNQSKSRHIQEQEILLIGGLIKTRRGYAVNRNMYRLDLHFDCIDHEPLPPPLQNNMRSAACVVNNDVIVTGGQNSLTQAWRYRPSLNSWKELAPMGVKRLRHGMAALNGQAYVVGGERNDTELLRLEDVEVYKETTNSWEKVTPLKLGVSKFGIATSSEKIYVFGGESRKTSTTTITTNCVQCYDPTEDAWTFATPLPERVRCIRAFTVKAKIYLFGGQLKCVLCYNPLTDSYDKIAAPWIQPYYDEFGATVCGSEIYIVGGCDNMDYDGTTIRSTVRYCDVSSGIISKGALAELPLPLYLHNAVTVLKR
ncbi:kelch-like protein 6 [Branchiostoma lanceolatum]|uniref:kelch-like protein 6 n=1 Tax=Branchiostoma lanceolatum TaxID=7740 RepID=UPI00345176C3